MDQAYWDDIEIGSMIETPARTMTEADIVHFAGLSGDYNPIHTDAEFAQHTIFGERIAHGLLGLSIASGLLTRSSSFGPRVMAFMSIKNWTFGGPVRIGDTIRVRATISNKRATSQADRGIVWQQIEVVNQRDEIVQSGEFVVMIQRRSAV